MRVAFSTIALAFVALAAALPAHAGAPDVTAEALFRRASYQWRTGDVAGAVRTLETIDFTAAIADSQGVLPRAAFLRVAGALRLRDPDGLSAAIDASHSLPPAAPEAAWISLLETIAHSPSLDAAAFLASPWAQNLPEIERRWWSALAAEGAGQDPSDALRDVARANAETPGERDLVAAARLRLATDALARGDSPEDLLKDVPRTSMYARRATHLRALAAIEAGDVATARAALAEASAGSVVTAEDRAIALAIAGIALEESRWQDAYDGLTAVESAWTSEGRAIETLAGRGAGAPIAWNDWLLSTTDGLALRTHDEELTGAIDRSVGDALRIGHAVSGPPPVPALRLTTTDEGLGFVLPPPDSALGAAARGSEAALERAAALLARERAALEDARADMVRRLAYLERGAARTDAEIAAIRELAARIDVLAANTAGALAKLAALRDEEIRRIAERTEKFLRLCDENAVIVRAIQRFRIDGPNSTRPDELPPEVPAPVAILENEATVADTAWAWTKTFAELMPELVRRSHAEVWEPRAREGPGILAREVAARLAEAQNLAAAIDSSSLAIGDPARLVPYEERVLAGETQVAKLERETRAARAAALDEALVRARAQHEAFGEGLAYSLAIASHELAVTESRARLTPSDPNAVRPSAVHRTEAAARAAAFLEGHPTSLARGEIRYRLADLEILRAREDFESKIGTFLEDPAAAKGTTAFAPYVDYAPAIALYRAILQEDPDYAHRDAVLYQVGMILSDEANPDARAFLEELVTLHPSSPFCARASLRMGDDDFEQRDLASAERHYEGAVATGDPDIRAIALYKLGWVRFNQDRHEPAAGAFLALLDLYDTNAEALAQTDLRREAEESLVHSLARSEGSATFVALFGETSTRASDARILSGLGETLRGANRYDDAVACDSLFLARHASSAEALGIARHLVATHEEASRSDRALEARLMFASRFRHDSDWARSVSSDSLRAEGDAFARTSIETVSLHRHDAARTAKSPAAWNEALTLHEQLLEGWPEHPDRARTRFLAGEAAMASGKHERAITHFETASQDTGALAADAGWQLVAVRDAWYEEARTSNPPAEEKAAALLAEIDRFTAARGGDPRVADAFLRKGDVARRIGHLEEAAGAYGAFLDAAPRDPRAKDAAQAAARALYDDGKFAKAGVAFGRAAQVARAAGADSLARTFEPLVPLCHFKEAERADADSSHSLEAAQAFESVAQRWPAFEHADRSLYRAGLAYSRAGAGSDAVRAWTALLDAHPKSELARDAHLQIASAWKTAERPAAAARAYERFSETYPDDAESADALLEAADLLAATDESGAEALRTRYMERFPGDLDAAFAILGTRAAKELESCGPDRPVSSLLPKAEKPAKKGKKSKASAKDAKAATQPATSLARYMELAVAHPQMASASLLAQVSYLEGEDARRAYEAARLTQPLAPAIAAKKALLETVLGEYRQCAELGVEPWSIAGTFRIGESLAKFGEALRESERPADISGEDLLAYEEVLETQSWEFADRAEETWSELLKNAQPKSDATNEWIARTRGELWPRLARRFVHHPELEYPLIAGEQPQIVPAQAQEGDGNGRGS